jgi:hypothetical protein
VVTAPLGWLKNNQGIFSPELPTRLSGAINAIGYGNLEKVRNSIVITRGTAKRETPPLTFNPHKQLHII